MLVGLRVDHRLLHGQVAFSCTNETKNISKAVNLTDEEISLVKELIERGDEVEIRMVPADKKMLAKNVL